jgi:RNA polymerase sigma-54 factor
LAGQLQEARWTVRNVEQRFSTIVSVAEAIVRGRSTSWISGRWP